MESYLSGRGYDIRKTESPVSIPEFQSLSSLLDLNKKASEVENNASTEPDSSTSEVIYE